MTINRRLRNTITNAFFTDIMSALLCELQTIVGRLLRGEGLSTDVECVREPSLVHPSMRGGPMGYGMYINL